MDAATLPIRRWTVDEFDQMAYAGLIAPRGHELIDGVVYTTNGFVQRWSVPDYDRMAEVGLITPEERAELVAGVVVEPPPFKWRRASVVMRVMNGFLWEAVRGFGIANSIGHIVFDPQTMLHPDVSVLRGEPDFYSDQYPGAGDVLLVMEIVEPLQSVYIEAKRDLYARAGIPEFWLVDPDRKRIVVHGAPLAGVYRDERPYRPGERWISMALGGRDVRVEDVLGPARK